MDILALYLLSVQTYQSKSELIIAQILDESKFRGSGIQILDVTSTKDFKGISIFQNVNNFASFYFWERLKGVRSRSGAAIGAAACGSRDPGWLLWIPVERPQ